jgi:hypothetical protein
LQTFSKQLPNLLLELQNLFFLEHVPHEIGGKNKGKEFLGTKGM